MRLTASGTGRTLACAGQPHLDRAGLTRHVTTAGVQRTRCPRRPAGPSGVALMLHVRELARTFTAEVECQIDVLIEGLADTDRRRPAAPASQIVLQDAARS